MDKNKTVKVQDIISLSTDKSQDYIRLTDLLKIEDRDSLITNWLKESNTLDFLGIWEQMYNLHFNRSEFILIKSQSKLGNFKISIKEWVKRTNSIGICAKTGKNGGIYVHKDIAFEFGSWINPIFKLYIIKEYQRLKEVESIKHGIGWNVKQILNKNSHTFRPDIISQYKMPHIGFTQKKEWVYASEDDMLNIIMFGCTAEQWRESNMDKAIQGGNIRDMASLNDLTILSNIESLNIALIKKGLNMRERAKLLNKVCKEQRKKLEGEELLNRIKGTSDNIPITPIDESDDDFDKGIDKILGFTIK